MQGADCRTVDDGVGQIDVLSERRILMEGIVGVDPSGAQPVPSVAVVGQQLNADRAVGFVHWITPW